MSEITTVGLDLAKNVFQVHAVDADVKRLAATARGAESKSNELPSGELAE